MAVLRDLFVKPVDRPIDGVVKADDTGSLKTEMEEYVITDEVQKQLGSLLENYRANEKGWNGVWISGFFGSGKSHLLKMLAYLFENKEVDGKPTLDYFLPKCPVDNKMMIAEMRHVCMNIPSKSILFDIGQKAQSKASGNGKQAIVDIFVNMFNAMCGYCSEQGYVAKFERYLDEQGLWDKFQAEYQKMFGKTWVEARKNVIFVARNVAQVCREITGGGIEDDIIMQIRKDYAMSIESFAEMVNDYINRQGPNFRLNFFVDEVGQFIAKDTQMMLELQTVVETLSTKCGDRAWVFVSSQQDLSKSLGGLTDSEGNDFSRIKDRFHSMINLSSKNVDEVIQKRLLEKKNDYRPTLDALYKQYESDFQTLFGFSDKSLQYKVYQNENDFADCYPFVPYQFSLFQGTLLELSNHNVFTGKYKSVGARSMLAVFQKVAVELLDKNVEAGEIAPFDAMYEGIQQSLQSNVVRAIDLAEKNLSDTPLAVRVLKALFMTKYLPEFKATQRNIVILMRKSFKEDSMKLNGDVETALNRLENNALIERNGDIYNFLTDEEMVVEEEIKGVTIEDDARAYYLNEIVFDQILGGTKINYPENRHPYTFGRKVEEHSIGPEKNVAIDLFPPWCKRSGKPDEFQSKSINRKELFVVMPSDAKYNSDVELYLKTQQYCKLHMSEFNESKRMIVEAKQESNRARGAMIRSQTENLLMESQLCVNGVLLPSNGENARRRLELGCHAAIGVIYTGLKELHDIYVAQNQIHTWLTNATQRKEIQDSPIQEDEQEVLNYLKVQKTNGMNTNIKSVVDNFAGIPFGWYQDALQCIIARLHVRGKIEMECGGQILEDGQRIYVLLVSPRDFEHVLLRPVEEYTSVQVKRISNFFHDFFGRPAQNSDGKHLGMELVEELRKEIQSLTAVLRSPYKFPFKDELENKVECLRDLAEKPLPYFFTVLTDEEMQNLLAVQTEFFMSVLDFMEGNNQKIWIEADELLNVNRENLRYAGGETGKELRDLLGDPQCFCNSTMPKVKKLTGSLNTEITTAIVDGLQKAKGKIDDLEREFQALEEYQKITDDDKELFKSDFNEVRFSLEGQTSISAIRDTVANLERTTYPDLKNQLVQKALGLPAPVTDGNPEPGQPSGGTVETAPAMPHTRFRKTCLESDDDVDEYIAAILKDAETYRKTLKGRIAEGKKLTVN